MQHIALVDNRIPAAAVRALELRGHRVLPLPACNALSAPLASHPDMLIARLPDTLITTAEYCEHAAYIFSDIRELSDVRICVCDEEHGKSYPTDAILNVLTLGKKLFAKCDTASHSVLSAAREMGYEIINVKQGYPACTVLPLGDGAAITADCGMARIMREHGIRVTLTQNGGIALPPYEYGFIGGCAGVFQKTVYFIGDPKTHPSADKILSAIESEGYSYVSLCPGTLLDLGRIIFI